jgi:hypothetical protein
MTSLEYKVQLAGKIPPFVLTLPILVLILLISTFVYTIFINKPVYAQNSNNDSGFRNTTYLALPNGKSIPIKYVMNTGKLLGVVLDKNRTTLDVIISPAFVADNNNMTLKALMSRAYVADNNNNGNLTIQIPRDIVDNKKEGNTDAPFRVHVDGKDATVRENYNTKTTRTLSIQFNKDAKVIDIIGSKSIVQ